ncbi:MAG TPA: hypothetical protein VKX28_29505 [Xanthobacteraceae bacterium]|nr:hypothetical protein [Xanthobacteraceae bacterium]
MALRTLSAATLAAIAAAAIPALARAPAPLVPIALVEDVKSASAGVEFMDYVGAGQVIKLGPHDTLVLSYLTSCQHETITGGTVTIGFKESTVQGGEVARATVPCDGGNMQMSSAEASKSAATAFRVQGAEIHPTIFARNPMVRLPKDLPRDARTLVFTPTEKSSERPHTIVVDEQYVTAGFYDMADINLNLTPGVVYEVTIGTHKLTFAVAPDAKEGRPPVATRLLRLP